MAKKTKKLYTVQVQIDLWTSVSIPADSFEDALAQARKLGVRDVVEFEGDFMDGEIKITGIYE